MKKKEDTDISLGRCTIEEPSRKCPVEWTIDKEPNYVEKLCKQFQKCKQIGSGPEHRCEATYTLMKRGIFLDTDARLGEGPETITFHSPPAGSYQVVVYGWDIAKDTGLSLEDARSEAVVKVYNLGTYAITCSLAKAKRADTGEKAETCESSVWKVFDIHVRDTGKMSAEKLPILHIALDDSSPRLVDPLPVEYDRKGSAKYAYATGVDTKRICYGGCDIPEHCRSGFDAVYYPELLA